MFAFIVLDKQLATIFTGEQRSAIDVTARYGSVMGNRNPIQSINMLIKC